MILFIINSVLFGIGLAVDAFTVSIANCISEPQMKRSKRVLMAGIFAAFQFAMPVIGWAGVRYAFERISFLSGCAPYVAVILLGYIGGKMIYDARKGITVEDRGKALGPAVLMIQGIATSIDALSVGFTIEELPVTFALAEAGIIGVLTFGICLIGAKIGTKAGLKLAGKANIAGGIILICIGVEILVKSFITR